MAYYNTFDEIITYDTSIQVTVAKMTNRCAYAFSQFVPGCTVTTAATEGIASSSTNYAEVQIQSSGLPDLYVRFYYYSTHSFYGYIAKTAGGTSISSFYVNFESSGASDYQLTMRFYNIAIGLYLYTKYTGLLSFSVAILSCTSLDGVTSDWMIPTSEPYSGAVPVTTGIILAGALVDPAKCFGSYDGTTQVIIKHVMLGGTTNSATNKVAAVINHLYVTSKLITTGIIKLDNKYFACFGNVGGSGCVLELNV